MYLGCFFMGDKGPLMRKEEREKSWFFKHHRGRWYDTPRCTSTSGDITLKHIADWINTVQHHEGSNVRWSRSTETWAVLQSRCTLSEEQSRPFEAAGQFMQRSLAAKS